MTFVALLSKTRKQVKSRLSELSHEDEEDEHEHQYNKKKKTQKINDLIKMRRKTTIHTDVEHTKKWNIFIE
jgi:hypothetical protein